ncbi:TonB-dependent receptor [Stenotrophomonas rhizophila]|uniref:TonB-dependent receptor n=1 Tax=Stenotrophomonas nematodicola TaxID=2656746 RepID=A0ABW7CSF1_9GAMM|nr:TonB-dependent receptor [Stenotrophomonas sp. BIGb0135]MCS4234589.1 iron complex outermembrane receptor protein [Stenotrophomonas sp. BIGb0135]
MKHPIQRLNSSRRNNLAHSVSLALTGSVMLLAGALASGSAFAQEQATNLDRITVTGSNIPRTNTETPSPVQVVTRQEIDRTGKTTVAEYLQTLTSDGAGSIPKTFGNGFAGGGAGISLRGLGAGSTLVLLNGRRMATYGLADDGQKVFTDLSTIPLDAVERIDILKDGASAIYGSDAIAGVVNIILRNDFQGAILRGSYGVSGDGDGDAKKATLTAGTGDINSDGWNAFFSLDVGKTDAIKISDRKNRKWIGTGDIRRYGYDAADVQFLGGAYLSGGTAGGTGPNGSVFNSAGQLVALPGCAGLTTIPGQTDATAQAQGCLWDPAQQFRDLSPEEKYVNVFGRASFAFGEGGEIYTEIGYSKKETVFSNTPSGVSGGWGYPGGPVNANSGAGATVLSPTHPDNPIPGQASRLRYSAWDVGPRVTDNTNEFNRFLVGVKGDWGDWTYDTAFLHSGTDLVNKRTGFLRYSAVRCALGNPACPGGVWRIGDNAGLNSQALYDYISPTISARAKSSLDMFNFTVSRSLMDLKGGPLGLAFGTEWRKTSNSLTPQTYTDQGDIIGLGYSAYDGTQNVYAAYAELSAPVLEQLELTGAVRFDKYESGDSKATPKLGIKWNPVDWLALRASYAEGFRAPNPAENGDGGLAAFSNARDPVRCAIDPANECTARSVAIITRPNQALKPEESKSYSFGIVMQPTSTTSLTVDAWEIKRTNEIAQGSTADAILAGNVLRDSNNIGGVANSGTILAVNTAYVNANSSRVRGIDTDIRQTFDLGPGQLEMDLQWSHLLKFERTEGDTTVDYVGTHGNCDVTNCIGTPQDRINFGTTWKQGDWSISGVVNYIDSMENKDRRGGDYLAFYEDGTPVEKIASFTSFDLSGRWAVTEAFELNASVQNVFDRIAPLDPSTYGAVNYNPLHFSGAIGRYFTVGAKYTFN